MSDAARFDLEESRPEAGMSPAARRFADVPLGDPTASYLPRFLSPAVLYLLGAILAAVIWLVELNPAFGSLALAWPWQLFRERGPYGGDLVFYWNDITAVAVVGFVLILGYVLLAVLPPRRGRGVAGLALGLFAFTSFLQAGEKLWVYAGMPIIAMAAGAVMLREGIHRGRGSRLFLGVMCFLLAAQLFFPYPRPAVQVTTWDVIRNDPSEYRSMGLLVWRSLTDRPPELSIWDMLRQPPTPILLGTPLLFLVALVSLLGKGGRWAAWAAGSLLLIVAIAPAALLYAEKASAAAQEAARLRAITPPPPNLDQMVPVPFHLGLAEAVTQLKDLFAAFLLPVAAAVVDLGRAPRGR